MEIYETGISGVLVLSPSRHADNRGFFSETYCRKFWQDTGNDVEFVQDNHSVSSGIHTVRGLHFQTPPYEQAKLVRVTRGAIRDVAIDIRRGSPTYGRHVAMDISAENWQQLFIPPGFAHGFMTLEPNTEVQYKVTAYYSPQHERGILWEDPALGISWPAPASSAVLSEKDKALPLLSQCETPFIYGGGSS